MCLLEDEIDHLSDLIAGCHGVVVSWIRLERWVDDMRNPGGLGIESSQVREKSVEEWQSEGTMNSHGGSLVSGIESNIKS
mmetsp:Transcript_102628/g.209052  ORF Transcript_102628/g.209052 Transcript_102628/m.209052 type:complete len:80 (+) Transcript_102628:791-1030(+)